MIASTKKGNFIPNNPNKYIGNVLDITYRSSWERFVMRWADSNPDIVAWGSEITEIPYICGTDNKPHKYYVDFTFKLSSGQVLLVEVKPKNQTAEPKKSRGKSKNTMLTESLAWIKNRSKWKYALEFAKRNNVKFEIWTEDKLKRLGMKII